MAKGASFINRVRLTLLRIMEAVGTTASNMATNAKLRANEINLENRRREILTGFSLRAFEMWQKGVQLPESLSEMLSELSEIEDRLSILRAQKYARVASEPAPDAGEPTSTPVCTVSDGESFDSESVPCEIWNDTVPGAEGSRPADAYAEETGSESDSDTAADEPAAEPASETAETPADAAPASADSGNDTPQA